VHLFAGKHLQETKRLTELNEQTHQFHFLANMQMSEAGWCESGEHGNKPVQVTPLIQAHCFICRTLNNLSSLKPATN
jgi:hypothetical protein